MNRNVTHLRIFFSSLNKRRFISRKVEEISENEPVKFSTSPAARRTINPSVKKNRIKMPWYQPYSVTVSVAVFLLYFCVLREENDIDLQFTKTLYDRMPGLEKTQLLQTYKYNKEQGKSVSDVERRLKELEMEEAKNVS